jgi:hypothetical protein
MQQFEVNDYVTSKARKSQSQISKRPRNPLDFSSWGMQIYL